jgi:hypothetical protein
MIREPCEKRRFLTEGKTTLGALEERRSGEEWRGEREKKEEEEEEGSAVRTQSDGQTASQR